MAGGRERPSDAQDDDGRAVQARSARSEDLPLSPEASGDRRSEGGDPRAAQGLPARLRAGRGLRHPVRALIVLCLALSFGARAEPDGKTAAQQQQQTNAAAAAAAGAGAVIVAAQAEAGEDPFAFPAPTPRARQWLGYASPWTLLILAGILVTLAALIKKVDPRRRKRIRRASILYMLYLTTFVFAAILGSVHAEGWAWRVWFLADLFEVLVIIDFVAILLFDLVLLGFRIEVANIVHDLALGAAYILAFIGILHRSGVQLSGITATSAVAPGVRGGSLQATL